MKQQNLKVLFVSHAYVVGVNQGKLNAISQTNNIEVGLLAPSNWKALEWNRLIPLETPCSHIRAYSAPVLFSGRGGAYIYAPWTLWQVLNDFRPDIVQVEEEVFSLCAFELAIWSRFTGKPLAIFGWENINRRLSFFRRWICQFVLNTASLVLPGNQDGADIMRRWGYTSLLEVMPQMGVDPEFFAPRQQKVDRPFHIGFLGRLTHSKGIDLIFVAAHQLRQQGFNFRILICGSGLIEAELKQLSQQQGIADWVIWQTAVPHEQVPEVISQFDVLVLPSRTTPEWKEQFGHVLIEAMAMGIPVVGSSSGEIPHVIGTEDLVFPEEDASELAAILKRMICEPEWRQEVRNYGLDRVNRLYTHQKIAQRLIDLWLNLTTGIKADPTMKIYRNESARGLN
ncbi:glycosyltransferase family 4 protein [Dolichospermum sp. ST_sed1]|nr:glycosyltransferase family 4 protein [Dolichospermum sp. ST_sed1]MDD1426584.1 glycosyltransferase family 4 protein [Dolichospermum sp. ST_sed9]MDD1430640.1 glycosyltransferase family 4 protein [Dolichospermum sp. ST_sed6]MDD1442506.1 glycosyltransferase family 4 protein [Dolichospermum sp. ST_sed3]MDD1444680.1 glycosyltransferase family 4 protein [Dolichospermum sp. ST_sed8]MDD1455601.1 glycosyltransferase family 4 protein [Dolichospermum sp. ST_sed7]MDD1462284.1 glycosyltransferase family